MSYVDFKIEALKGTPRATKDIGTVGVYDFYKHIRKNKWYNIGRPVTEHEFYSIVRKVNKLLAEGMAKGETVYLPHKMGGFELRKLEKRARFYHGKLIVGYPVDWKSTWELWSKDAEAYDDKILVRFENRFIYYIKYNKQYANYKNQSFFEFTLNRNIKRALSENINNGKVDTIW